MKQHDEDSTLISKGPCDACGSSDANALYDDMHTYCFSCGKHTQGEGVVQPGTEPQIPGAKSGLISGSIKGLRSRKITDETCKHFGYRVGLYKGKTVQIAPYYDRDGQLVAQHLRTQDKQFPWLGKPKGAMPFGYHAFQKSGKMLTIVEGEIDALSLSQAQGNKWPVWSIGSGAGPQVKRYIAERRNLFTQFERVTIMFDNDEAGREAAEAAAGVLGARAHIAELPQDVKDANDMLRDGRTRELLDTMWKAQPYRPEGIVELSTCREDVFRKIEPGLPWCMEELNKLTYGRRTGEIYAWGAGTGTGKTDLFLQQVEYDIMTLGIPVGIFFMEQSPTETAIRIIGKVGQKPFHIPDAAGTEEEMEQAWEKFAAAPGKVYAHDSFGQNEWDVIKERIRFLYHAHDVRHFYLDHLTALAGWQDDERRALEVIMSELGGLVKELDIAVYLISHLATPEGKPHEEGGRVMIRHFKGSRSIGFWCHFMFGLERDQQAEDPVERITTTVRCLKDRFTGRGTGQVFHIRYHYDTGMLHPVTFIPPRKENPFHDETPQEGPKDF